MSALHAPWLVGGDQGADPDRGGHAPIPLAIPLLGVFLLLMSLTASVPPGTPAWPAEGEDDGMPLLQRAAKEGENTSYEGVQSVATRTGGDGDTVTRLVRVVHEAGEGTGFASSPAAPHSPRAGGDGVLVVGQSPSLRLDARVLRALESNFRVTRAGTDTVHGRRARVVEARRADGTVAGRFWIDAATTLPLRKDTCDTAGRSAKSTGFVEVDVGGTGPLPAAKRAEPWGDTVTGPELSGLRDAGWELPERLSWDFPLVDAWSKGESGRRVLHLGYSDGLTVVSVFVQRGRLSPDSVGTGTGLRPVVEDGGTVYVSGGAQQRRMWESGGYVYTVLANSRPEAAATAVEGLPDPDGSGFWSRVGRGFGRIGSWTGA